MDFQKEFKIAHNILQQAGDIVLSYYEKKLDLSYKGEDNSIVTQADTQTEIFIRENLNQQFPNYGFIGEEGKEIRKETFWVVDPIDGTTGFSHGIPEFGIALAFVSQEEILFSLGYFPIFQTMLAAKKGQGTYKNGVRVHISTVTDITNALFAIGNENIKKTQYQKETLALLTGHRYRIGHSSLVESAYLAEGKIDAIVKRDQPIWDIAPEYLLMKEAGAVITDIAGAPLHLFFTKDAKHSYIAANKKLAEKIKEILSQASLV